MVSVVKWSDVEKELADLDSRLRKKIFEADESGQQREKMRVVL